MRNILLFLLSFLGFSAIGGGGVLIISPTGEMIGMPLSLLKNSPFGSFLIPGSILFTIFGLFPILLTFALIKKPDSRLAERLNFFRDMRWAWTFTVYTAFALIIWLQTEMFFLQGVGWLHNIYMFLAIAIIFVSLLP